MSNVQMDLHRGPRPSHPAALLAVRAKPNDHTLNPGPGSHLGFSVEIAVIFLLGSTAGLNR